MKNIDIKNNISDQDALKHKSFDKVFTKYQALKVPFYKTPWFGGSAFIVALVTTFIVVNNINSTNTDLLNNFSYTSTYNSPIDEIIEFDEYIIDINNDKSSSFTTKSGSKITIPANTLVDSLGKLITGSVVFKYREFLNQKDIFMSGIPMNYDSSGVAMNFESGGMFELLSYQNNNPLFIAKNKSVQVDLASEQIGDNFNLYYYSAEEQKWIYNGKDLAGYSNDEVSIVEASLSNKLDSVKSLMDEKLEIANSIEVLKNQKPIKPKVLDKEKYSFTINVDYKDFPELKAFKGLKFQVSDKEKNFNPSYAQTEWEDVTISSREERSEYNTCFANKIKTVCFITNPVVDEKNIDLANKSYDRVYEEYLAIKDSLKERKKVIRKALAKQSEELAERRRIELNRRNAEMAYEMENKVTRTFQIAQFGIWNSDCPQKLPTEAIVKAKFVNEKGEELKFDRIYLVLKERNEVITISSQDLEKGLRYNPKEECMIWGVTNDNKSVGYIQSNQFKNINNAKSFTFNMDFVASKEFVNYSIEELLNL